VANAGKATAKEDPAKKRCFVIGPIGGAGTPIRTHADWLLEGIIQPAFEAHFPEFKVDRSDRITEPGMIDSQMINLLLDAELVIADMSLSNANAFYEMGIRHMVQKPIIHMYLEGSDIPFDVKPYRAVSFSVSHPSHLVTARKDLVSAVTDAIAPDHKIDNPVTRAKGQAKFEQEATPKEKILIDEVRSLSERLANFERQNRRIDRPWKSAVRMGSAKQLSSSEQYEVYVKLASSTLKDLNLKRHAIDYICSVVSPISSSIEIHEDGLDLKFLFNVSDDEGPDIFDILSRVNSHPAVASAGLH
jgi:hypothetical protein